MKLDRKQVENLLSGKTVEIVDLSVLRLSNEFELLEKENGTKSIVADIHNGFHLEKNVVLANLK